MAKPAKVKVRVSTQPVVVMEAEVARKIRQHARASMKAEVCGVLIGNTEHERMTVEACIAGINAAQGGAHVTFTQDTWEHIYKIKDKEYPDHKIVGWYHSHPGFGVFLSEHDLFIQQNFFSNAQQVAWVYDPHTDEEGCFGWVGGNIEKLSAIRVGYTQSVEIQGNDATADQDEMDDGAFEAMVRTDNSSRSPEPAWMKWTSRVMGYLAAIVLGFVVCFMFLNWRWAPVLDKAERVLEKAERYDQMVEMLRQYQEQQQGTAGTAAPAGGVAHGGQSQPAPGPENQRQSPPQQRQAQPAKGNNGKQ
ncbi:MAG TPA: Mov34/MPN/PAD-1 family protein [Candidatus Angelobacter sp.]|nr:Mov34/MPN/PAD-1 family protein [Candidatus Angelobacter sp.]